MNETITLYRPTGPKELELVRESGWTSWPPRLRGQPIFYPVLNEEYAIQIARDWNAKDPSTGYRGYVTRFQVRAAYLSQYEIKTVGSHVHQEYWIQGRNTHWTSALRDQDAGLPRGSLAHLLMTPRPDPLARRH